MYLSSRHQPLRTNPTRISGEVYGDGIIIFLTRNF